MKTKIAPLLLAASLASFIMALASPLLAVSSRVVVGFGRVEYAAVDVAETLSVPQTVARLAHAGEMVLTVVVLLSCIVFPVLKMGILCAQWLGRGTRFFDRASRFLEHWSFLELMVVALFLAILKADKHLEVHSGAAVGWLVGAIVLSAVAHAVICRNLAVPSLRPVLAMLAVTTLTSCGKPPSQHYVILENLGGVAVGSGVLWHGAEIGKVSSIGPDNGKLKVTMEIYPQFTGALHAGAIAEVPAFAVPVLRGRIVIIDGDNPTASILTPGTEIPAREVNAVTDAVGLAKDYLKQAATEVQKKFEAGTAGLKSEIPKKLDEASNAAADTLDALAKKLRKTQNRP